LRLEVSLLLRIDIVMLLLVLSSSSLATSCRWREGREVWTERYDAGDPDAWTSDCGAPGDPCWIPAYDLFTLIDSDEIDLAIVDLRSEELCRANRIPGALCIPWSDDGFAAEVDCSGSDGRLILYDGNGENLPSATGNLDEECERSVYLLQDGFAGWSACADCPIEQDEADAG